MPELKFTKQEEFSKSLRALADWYDQHPSAPVPDQLKIDIRFDAKQLPTIPADETREDVYLSPSPSKYSVGLYRRFLERDGYVVQFYTGLDGVAEKKVTGQKVEDVVEWVVKMPIAGVPEPVAASEASVEG